jgi:hypothetical protein
VKIALGTFTCMGIESRIGSDLAKGVRAAVCDYAQRLESGSPPMAMPRFGGNSAESDSTVALDLPVDARTLSVLEREAMKQGATVSQLAAHSVLVYLAELDRLSPPAGLSAV